MFHPEGTFTLFHHVDFYECDLALRMRPANLVRVLQQAGEDQLSSLGMNYHTLKDQHGMGFVTSRVILEIDRMPTAEEDITVETCPMGSKGSQFFRQAQARDSQGNILARFYTSWTLVELETMKILRPQAFPLEMTCGELEIDPKEFRFRTTVGQPAEVRPVRYSDLDANGHVNNAVYYDIICDLLPLEKLKENAPKRICLCYAHQAVPGRELELLRCVEEGEYHLVGRQGDQTCFEARVTLAEE